MKAKLIVHAGQKGGTGSGFHGHAGRPGEVGGSSASGIKINIVDTVDELKKIGDMAVYYIMPNGKLADAIQDVEGQPGGKHHGGLMALGNARQVFGLSDKYKPLQGMPTMQSEAYEKYMDSWSARGVDIDQVQMKALVDVLHKGFVRVNVGRGATNIQTFSLTDGVLHKLQDMFYKKKLLLEEAGSHWWEDAIEQIAARFKLPEFLVADKVTDLEIQGTLLSNAAYKKALADIMKWVRS
jgi:hypothetical protein